jgi:hypothetical protein
MPAFGTDLCMRDLSNRIDFGYLCKTTYKVDSEGEDKTSALEWSNDSSRKHMFALWALSETLSNTIDGENTETCAANAIS